MELEGTPWVLLLCSQFQMGAAGLQSTMECRRLGTIGFGLQQCGGAHPVLWGCCGLTPLLCCQQQDVLHRAWASPSTPPAPAAFDPGPAPRGLQGWLGSDVFTTITISLPRGGKNR